LLLASDPLFLITNTVDWGPVAVGHLLLVAACWAASRARFATCGFLLGLALWNKATFIWALAGLSAAVFVVYLPELRRIADRRTVIRAAIAFLLGAAPLLIYNALHPNATLSTNAKLSFDSLNDKVRQVEGALNGSSLQGYITNVEFSGRAKTVGSPVGRAAIWLESTFGSWRQSLFSYAVLLAVLALPFWWRTGGRRLGLFAIVFLVVAFLAMAVSKGGGGGAHHAVLLWPMFHVLVAVALCAVRVRWVSEGVVALLLIGNLLVVNQHFAQLERNGAKGPFNDAIYPLTRSQILRGRHVYVADWGIFDSLDVLTRGELDLRVASGPFMGGIADEIQQREIRDLFADEVGVVVAHVAAEEMFAGINGRIDAAASAAGYRKEVLETVADSNSRPFFEVYRFVRR